MAGELTQAAVEAGGKAVMDLSLSGAGFSVSLKIDNVWLAGAVGIGALSLGAFYLACKGPAEGAIKRALERKIFGIVDPEVTNITDGHSILVELFCRTETSLLLLLEDFETKTTKFRLEEEFKKIHFKDELDVIIRNNDKVNEEAEKIRARSKEQKEVPEMGNWKHKFEELAKLIDKIYEMQGPVLQLTDKQTNQSTEEPISRVRKLERLFGEFGQRDECASSDLLEELNNVKETLKQEMTISKGLRRTIENLQEENKTLAKTAEHERNDGIEIRKIYNLEFKVQSKTKDEERASSVISLGASSGYQSEEPDESSLTMIQMPQSQAIQEGKKLVLSCRTRGLPDVRYRWVKDDVEVPGANRSDLVLEQVRMQDFGRYVCRVWDKSGSVTSDTAEIDVFPAPQMRFRGLHEIDTDTKQAIIDLLSKKRLPGLATWKQVARRYAMRETEISLLEIEKIPAGAMLDRLGSLAPNLTVYYLCKTFKEPDLRRQDIVNILSKQIVISIR